ncbi:hypothetical protein [Streptomyces sp. NPDC047525]|uniref:hypothetical protein n=1 Tax=Streptomyces sp. NPDC047525 TaxID=3155264 RepID=UPI0033C1AFE7
MNDDVRNILLGIAASGISAGFGWFTRTYLWRRALVRKQRFFGLAPDSECLLVVNGKAGDARWAVARHDVFALLELSMLIKECKANVEIVAHDTARRGWGETTEFCVGGPVSNSRMAAHLRNLLPGFTMNTVASSGPDCGAFAIGGDVYRMERGRAEHVLLARVVDRTEGQDARPIFLICGQHSNANHAAARYLSRHHARLASTYKGASFCQLLRVVDSQAYGPEVVELIGDVTQATTTPPVPA